MTDLQDGARDALRDLVTRAGRDIVSDPRRLKAMLADALPTYRIEAGVLGAALDEGIVAELHGQSAGASGPTHAQLASRLARARAMSPDAARWSIDAWASSLGIAIEVEGPPVPTDLGTSTPPTVTGSGPHDAGPTSPVPPWRPSRAWLWPVAGACAALVLLAIAVFLATRGTTPDDPPPVIPWNELQVGHCHDVPADMLSIELIACAEPHDREVFDVRTFTNPAGDPYPADIAATATTDCQGAPFTDYVGIGYLSSIYYVDFTYPSVEAWQSGQRELICELYDPDGPLAGSKAGAAE